MPDGSRQSPYSTEPVYPSKFGLTAAMGATGQAVPAASIGRLVNNQNAAQTQTITIYDSATVAGIAAANQLWTGLLGTTPVDLNLPLSSGGFVIQAAAAITGIVWATYG